jgi:hypothetical protein
VLLVEQRAIEALQNCNRGYVLETGRVVLEGTQETLLANDRVRQAGLGFWWKEPSDFSAGGWNLTEGTVRVIPRLFLWADTPDARVVSVRAEPPEESRGKRNREGASRSALTGAGGRASPGAEAAMPHSPAASSPYGPPGPCPHAGHRMADDAKA